MQKTKGEFPPSGNPTLFNIEIGKAFVPGLDTRKTTSQSQLDQFEQRYDHRFFSRPAQSQHKGDIAHLSVPDGHKLDLHRLRDTHIHSNDGTIKM